MKNELLKVSIIIPIYNCENYLERCIHSIFEQSLEELEIICIDDGSTDKSAEIIKRFQSEDARIILHQQHNQGAGIARNWGLQKARGKYVAFLDADDYYMDSNALQVMFQACENRDICLCGSRRIYMEGVQGHFNEMYSEKMEDKILDYKDYQSDYFYQSYLIRRQMLMDHQIVFPSYRRYQDPPFFVRAAYTAGYFIVVDTCLYAYQMPEAHTRYDKEKTCDLLRGIKDVLLFAAKHDLGILIENTLEHLEFEFAYIIYENITSDDLDILYLLIEVNQIIHNVIGKKDYIIKPLRLILFSYEQYEEGLLKKIREVDELILYGAGRIAKAFLSYLQKKQLIYKVKSIVVTNLDNNVTQIDRIPVISLNQFKGDKNSSFLVVVGKKMSDEITDCLQRRGYFNYEILDEIFGDKILQRWMTEKEEKTL